MYVTRYDIFGPNAALRHQGNNVTNAAYYKYKISPAVLVCFTIKPLLFVENLFTVNGGQKSSTKQPKPYSRETHETTEYFSNIIEYSWEY